MDLAGVALSLILWVDMFVGTGDFDGIQNLGCDVKT